MMAVVVFVWVCRCDSGTYNQVESIQVDVTFSKIFYHRLRKLKKCEWEKKKSTNVWATREATSGKTGSLSQLDPWVSELNTVAIHPTKQSHLKVHFQMQPPRISLLLMTSLMPGQLVTPLKGHVCKNKLQQWFIFPKVGDSQWLETGLQLGGEILGGCICSSCFQA